MPKRSDISNDGRARSAPRGPPVQRFLPSRREPVDHVDQLAPGPDSGPARLDLAILVDDRHHEPARAQHLAQRAAIGRIGVKDHHHIALDELFRAVQQRFQLAGEIRVIARLGHHHDDPVRPDEITHIDLARVKKLQPVFLEHGLGRLGIGQILGLLLELLVVKLLADFGGLRAQGQGKHKNKGKDRFHDASCTNQI